MLSGLGNRPTVQDDQQIGFDDGRPGNPLTDQTDELFDQSLVKQPINQAPIEDMSIIQADQTNFMNQTDNIDFFGEDDAGANQQRAPQNQQ